MKGWLQPLVVLMPRVCLTLLLISIHSFSVRQVALRGVLDVSLEGRDLQLQTLQVLDVFVQGRGVHVALQVDLLGDLV